MKANPGGKIDISDIIGRDRLIAQLWQILEQQSVIITSERRIGKTSVIEKMKHSSPEGWFAIYQDLEGIRTADEFAQAISLEVEKYLGTFGKLAHKSKRFLEEWKIKFSGAEVQHQDNRSWKQLLECAIEDLIEQQIPNRLVFLWDEMPYMLDNLSRHNGPETAEEMLDVLRAIRHKFPAFRMVLTGSIGLHHVIARLRDAAYSNEPINDMYRLEVPPLEQSYAEELAGRLIEGENIPCDDLSSACTAMAKEADCVPFYIHHIARSLKMSDQKAAPNVITALVEKQLIDPNDPWELGHYRDRMAGYYDAQADLAKLIMDELSLAAEPLSVNQLFEFLKAQIEFNNRNLLLDVLRMMERDHYLIRVQDSLYAIRFPLIKRWWKLDRGL
jgi:hypothetical protein